MAAWCVLSASSIYAIGTPDDQGEDIFSLGEVVISGSTDVVQAGETVHEITSEDIQKSSARTLDEALTLLSDVNVRVGAEGTPRIEIRGFKTRHVLLLLDGVPMNSAFDQQFDPAMIPVENIAKIKVTSGASSVLYGQGGLGGVINIITKKGRKGLSGMVGMESGDGQPYLGKASLSGGKGMFDFFLSGSAFRRDNFPLAKSFTESAEEKSGYRKNSDSTRNNVFLNIGFTPNDKFNLTLTGTYVGGGYGKPASAINNKFDPYASPPRFGRVDDFTSYSWQLAADYSFSNNFNIRSVLFYNHIDQDNNQYDDENYRNITTGEVIGTVYFEGANHLVYKAVNDQVPNSFMLKNTGISRGASIQPKYDFGKGGIITLGFSGEWDSWMSSGIVKPGGDSGAGGGFGVGGGSPPYNPIAVSDNKDLFISSAAIEYEYTPLKNLGFSVGYAYHWQFRDERNASGYSVSLSSYYDIFRDTRLKAAFQRNIRFPSLSQLYLRDSNNPNLTTERVFHYQMGIEQKLPFNSMFKIDGFNSDAYNLIALDQNVTPARNRNFSWMRFYGFETSLETRPLRNLELKAGYTFLESEDHSGTGREHAQYVPRDKVTVVCKYDFDFGLTALVSSIYSGNSYVYTKQKIATVGGHMMANYTLFNVKFSQRLLNDRLTLYIGADNILNKEYEQTYGIPRPGRYIFGGLEYRFSL